MGTNEQILKGISGWISYKIDELVGNNILMALMSETIKRVASQFVETAVPPGLLELVFCNHGVVDADVFAGEIVRALQSAPDYSQEFKGVDIHLSRGTVKIELPSNAIVKALLNGDNVIVLKEPDIRELAQYINNAKNE